MDKPHLEIGAPTSIKIKRGPKKTTFVEAPKHVQEDVAEEMFHTPLVNPTELKALLDREAPLERVVVRCNRETGKWQLYRNNEPYKEMTALILINVSFSCQWLDENDRGRYQGCGNWANGRYSGFAAGDVLPVSTPLSVPSEGIISLKFNPDNGQFYDASTGNGLTGAGYLILKEGCSSEYVTASAIGAA